MSLKKVPTHVSVTLFLGHDVLTLLGILGLFVIDLAFDKVLFISDKVNIASGHLFYGSFVSCISHVSHCITMLAKLYDVLFFHAHVWYIQIYSVIIVDHFIKGTQSTTDVMRYDERIDDVILKILCTKRPVSYLRLKRNVDSVFEKERLNLGLKPRISFETFNSHY
ncbi:MAG TPA: hypothetical protein VEL11_15395 [Candidatus Bathyarchaeia archaeon]|nr:hypothetical protein [Candidatus Bathyarchaeia archaeon]